MAGGEFRFGTASIYMTKHGQIRERRTSLKSYITWLRSRPVYQRFSRPFNGLVVFGRRKLSLMLGVTRQQPILDQPHRAAAPGIVSADAQSAVRVGEHLAGPRVAQREPHDVFSTADPPHDSHQRLLRAQLARNGGIAP